MENKREMNEKKREFTETWSRNFECPIQLNLGLFFFSFCQKDIHFLVR